MRKHLKKALALTALLLALALGAPAEEAVLIPVEPALPTIEEEAAAEEAAFEDGTAAVSEPVEPPLTETECALGEEDGTEALSVTEAADMPAEVLETMAAAQTAVGVEASESPAEAAPASSPAPIRLGKGEKATLPEIEGTGTPTYTSANAKIATVSAGGVVKGKKRGSTTVVAVRGDTVIEYAVEVLKPPKSIKFSKKRLTLGYDAVVNQGEALRLNPKLTSGSSSKITYSGYNRKVISVSPEGVVTAVGLGTTKVTARTYNKKKAKITVKVVARSEPIEPAITALTLGVGEKSAPLMGSADVSAAYGGVTFSSSNKRIATVSAAGVVKAKAKGTATIRIKGANGGTASVKVKVLKAPSRVTLKKYGMTIEQYSFVQLIARIPKNTAGSIQFTSSDTSIVQVDEKGVMTGVGLGSAVVTARAYNGKKARCSVDVVETLVEIRIPEAVTVAASEYIDFPIEIVTSKGEPYVGEVRVRISPDGVASYENGKVLGRRSGKSALLTVEAADATRDCVITVTQNPVARNVKVIAHRGGARWPENSLEAFANFASTGADAVELDVRFTSDGVPVVIHDATYFANALKYTVAGQTLELLRSMNPSICTLDEALEAITPSGKEIFLNPKEQGGEKLVEAVRARGLQSRTVYFCADEEILKQIYAADDTAVLGYSLSAGSAATGDSLKRKVGELHLSYIMPHRSLVTLSVVNYWKKAGCKVCTWTVNDRSAIRSMCDMGVDAIMSDYPETCVEVKSGG